MDSSLLDVFDRPELVSLRRRLGSWFKKHGRDLPWRETHDPYRIWISEIMLQQTTVKAVVPYYEKFVGRFPTVAKLAAATEEEVLQYWEGLGYYSRGRNLRKAAIVIQEEHNGQFPGDLASLISLPGIGRYTAGAIRSFAFDLPAPIVEANTLRLYCRLLNYAGDPRSREGENLLWAFAERLQSKKNSGRINQSLMELGSQVCTPVEPNCEECPLKIHCRAAAVGTQDSVPQKKTRPAVTQVVEATIAVRSGNRYLLRQRQTGERWAGMWDFVRFPIDAVTFKQKLSPKVLASLNSEVCEKLSTEWKQNVNVPTIITELRHSVTRYRIRLICLSADVIGKVSKKNLPSEFQWIKLQELDELPMPVTGRQFANLLKEQL